MYCGDETGSFIGEIGSGVCKFGYGGEDNPKLVTSPYVVSEGERRYMSSSSLHFNEDKQQMESILRMPISDDDQLPITNPNSFLRQGDIVEHWDNVQTCWEISMNILHAKDTLKHTKGGTPYTRTTKNKIAQEASSSTEFETDQVCVHPILAITPGYTHCDGYGQEYIAAMKREQYTKYTELLIESIGASSMFLAPSPMLAAFSLGRQTAVIVDIGASGSCVTPIVDGLVLKHSQRRNGRGGDWLGNITWKAILEQTKLKQIQPRYMTMNKKSKPSSSSIFYRRAIYDLMYEIRTEPFITLHDMDSNNNRIPFLSGKVDSSSSAAASPGSPMDTSNDDIIITESQYQLPDGTTIDLSTSFGQDLCQLPELLFSDTLPFTSTSTEQEQSTLLPTMSTAPLHKLVHESLLAVGDVDVRKELAGSICLVGGTSLLPNIDTRLSQEVTKMLPSFVRPKIVASKISVERSCASWIGGSILTSLGSFQQLWLSKAEYDEYGATLAVQRFP
jgi:actin-related protein